MGLIHKPIPPDSLKTARLTLRKPRLSDAEDIFYNYASDSEVTRYVTWRPHRDPTETFAFREAAMNRWDSGEEYSWAVTIAPEDRVIGMIAWPIRGHATDIGCVIAREYWGQGFMTEAAHEVVDWAFTLESIYRVWAVCDVENKPSARVMEKLGMQREEVLRRYIDHPNLSTEPRDVFVYSKVR